MKPYTHLTDQERDKIAVLRSRGHTLRDIARILGRHFSSLSRELRRNRSGNTGYFPHKAQERAIQRRQNHKRMRLKNRTLRHNVEELLIQGWSPEIIAGRLKREQGGRPIISHEAIYQWVYTEAPHLIQALVRSHPKRWPRHYSRKRYKTHIPRRISIQDRPGRTPRFIRLFERSSSLSSPVRHLR